LIRVIDKGEKGADELPDAKKFFATNLEALASSNIDGDHLSDSSPKNKTPKGNSFQRDSSSERDVQEELGKEAPDYEYGALSALYRFKLLKILV
jgi:hypothetical protein